MTSLLGYQTFTKSGCSSAAMARKTILVMLVWCSSCNILLSEGSAANQTNSTQNSTTVVASLSPQTISPTTALSQASTTTNDTSSIYLAANSSVSSIEPSSTVVQASSSISGDTIQISAAGLSSGGNLLRYVVLPPQHERRDYNLVAKTRLRWVNYLMDKSGPEFSVLKQHVEVHLNKIFEGVAGFLKSEVTEFIENNVTFYAIIYTKSANRVSKTELQDVLARSMLLANQLNIDTFQITPRFTEMHNSGNGNVNFVPKKGEEAEVVDVIMNFLRGFGAMLAFVVLFASVRFIQYKACNKKKQVDSDQQACVQETFVNDVNE